MNISLTSTNVDTSLPLAEQFLQIRQIEESLDDFINVTWQDVQSPYDLENIEAAADKILQHMRGKRTIAIIVDSDSDGYTSAAIFANYFYIQQKYGNFGELPEFKFLFHEKKERGLADIKIMRELRDLVKPALLVIPDASGTDLQYKALNDLGIDIVVLDHHDTKNKGDGVNTIVVNNQQSPKYRNKELSGAGIVWQLCRVLDDKLELTCAEMFMDLAAIGNAADVMSVTSRETRFLVLEGLKEDCIRNPFLLSLIDDKAYQLKNRRTLYYDDAAWYIGPTINAIVRVGTAAEKELVFKSMLEMYAEESIPSGNRNSLGEMVPLAQEAMRQANNAKGKQDRRKKKLIEAINDYIRENGLDRDKVLIIPTDDLKPAEQALTGLIAGDISESYRRPCILMVETEKGKYQGSLRAPDKVTAFANFKDQCAESGLVDYAAGHQSAAGIGIQADNIEDLRRYFNERFDSLSADDMNDTHQVDFVFGPEDDLSELADFIERMTPYWGQGFKKPKIAITKVPLSGRTVNFYPRNPTISVALPSGASCIKFRSSQEEYESMILPYNEKAEQQYLATFVGELGLNEFRGEAHPQLKVSDYSIDEVAYVF